MFEQPFNMVDNGGSYDLSPVCQYVVIFEQPVCMVENEGNVREE